MAVSTTGCRVIVDPVPQSGAWNMAVDELLLQAAVEPGQCALRCYRWDQPTLSLGYFQDASQVVPEAGLRGLPVVRRLSGGGAIVHDDELTYSCAIPPGHPLAAAPRSLYDVVHAVIIRELAGFGIETRLRGTEDPGRAVEFLCFGRGDAFDVVIGENKVLGSAQRRRKGAVLQHGSLVLRRSPRAPGFPGIFDLSGRSIDVEDLARRLVAGISGVLSAAVEYRPLSDEEIQAAGRIVDRNANSAGPRV